MEASEISTSSVDAAEVSCSLRVQFTTHHVELSGFEGRKKKRHRPGEEQRESDAI